MDNNFMKRILLTLVLTLISFNLHLSELQSQVRKLTLDEAIELALEKNYDAQTAKLEVKKAEARKSEAIGYALPSLSINASYINNPIKPKFFLPNFANPESKELVPVEIGANNAFTASAELTQVLFNSAVLTGIGTAKIYHDVSKEQYKSALNKTIANVRRTFYAVLLASGVVDVMETTIGNARRNLVSVELMYKEGFIPEFDLIRARTSVQNLEPELLNARNTYNNLLNTFKLVLAIDVRDSIELIGNIEEVKVTFPDIKDVYEELKKINYDLRAMEKLKQLNNEMINIYESEYYPTLVLFGNYQYQGQSNTWDFQTVNSASVGLGLSLSLFQGLQTNNRVQQAKIEYLTTNERYNQLFESIKLGLNNSYQRLNFAKEKIKAVTGNIEQAARGFEIAEIRYKEGIGSQVEIYDANTALANANLGYIQAIYDYLDAVIEIESFMGIVPSKYIKQIDN